MTGFPKTAMGWVWQLVLFIVVLAILNWIGKMFPTVRQLTGVGSA
jgi:hypothetical protein